MCVCREGRGSLQLFGYEENVPSVELTHPVFTRMPGGITVGDPGLCCYVPCILSAVNSLCLLIL